MEDLVSLPRKCRELLIEKLVRTTQLPIGEVAKLERIDRAELPCRRASATTTMSNRGRRLFGKKRKKSTPIFSLFVASCAPLPSRSALYPA